MDAKSYNAALADLRAVRDQIKKARAALAKQEADRDKRIVQLAAHEKATAQRIAPAAGLSVADVVALVPGLAPGSLAIDDSQPQATEPSVAAGAGIVGSTPAPPQHAAAAPTTPPAP
ncbi:hypothetical protein O3S80_51800, partial [Streptomyces sp. Lzd4kr]|nr:hypothetical protein [Streptomyces sp. Lzd4kr]